MGSTILTPQIISNELLRRFKNNLAFAGTCKHEHDDKFGQEGGKIGDTYNLRVPVKYLAVDGAVISIQDTTENKIPLVINQQKHTAFSFTSKDLTLTIDRFGDRYLKGASLALANAVDVFLLTTAYQGACNQVGVPGTVPTTLLTYLQAGEALDRNTAPVDDRNICITPKMQTNIVDGLKGLLNNQTEVGKQYIKGRMGNAAGFEWLMDQNMRTHKIGPLGGAPLVNGANQTGTALLTKGWSAAAASRLKKGDKFTIGTGATSVFAVNPVSIDAYSDLRQFTVMSDFSSLADGTGSVTIYPPMIAVGPNATVSVLPADGAAITVVTDIAVTGGLSTPQGLAYHKEAVTWAMVPMEMPNGVHFSARSTDKETGVSIRVVSQYDITNDIFATRCDIMFGAVLTHPEWLVAISS